MKKSRIDFNVLTIASLERELRRLLFLWQRPRFLLRLWPTPLPSWSDTDTKSAIIEFVERVTDPASPDYVTPSDRIATFDNDGNLWAELPVCFQPIYAFDRVREKAAADPSILTTDALAAAADWDIGVSAIATSRKLPNSVNLQPVLWCYFDYKEHYQLSEAALQTR